MEGTQKPWWIRSVCCCLGFAKPFSYIVPALKILGNCSADNFVMKLNMSGWQRLSCLILFFFLSQFVHCDSVIDSRDRMRGPCSFTHLLVPARRLLILQEIKPQQHSPASSFSPFLCSPGSMGHLLSTCWQCTFSHQQAHVPNTPCFLLLCFLVYLSISTKMFTFYKFTHIVWKKNLHKKRKRRQFDQIWDCSLLFSKETGNWWYNSTPGFALTLHQTVMGKKERRKEGKLSVNLNTKVK